MAHRGQDSSTEAPDKQCTFPSISIDNKTRGLPTQAYPIIGPSPPPHIPSQNRAIWLLGAIWELPPLVIRLYTNATQGAVGVQRRDERPTTLQFRGRGSRPPRRAAHRQPTVARNLAPEP